MGTINIGSSVRDTTSCVLIPHLTSQIVSLKTSNIEIVLQTKGYYQNPLALEINTCPHMGKYLNTSNTQTPLKTGLENQVKTISFYWTMGFDPFQMDQL